MTTTIKKSAISRALSLFAVIALTAAAHAATININWVDDGRPGYTGEGILTPGDVAGVWNNHSVVGDNPVPPTSQNALLDSEGNLTSVDMNRTGGRFLYYLGQGGTGYDLFNGGLVDYAMSVTLSGLTPGKYKVAAMGKYNANLIEFSIDGGTPQTVGNGAVSNMDPTNWAIFDITVVDSGGGTGGFTLNVPNIAGESTFNAMQIQEVPEPATAALIGLPLLGLILRRRR